MSGSLFVLPDFTPLDGGAIVPGGKLTFSRTGTSTPQNTYSDSALTVANSNPVIADDDGVFSMIYLDNTTGYDYRVTYSTSADVQIWQRDDIKASNSSAPNFRAVGTTPEVIFQESDASANNTRWRIRVDGETLYLSVGNDAESSWSNAIQIDRTNNTVDAITFSGKVAVGSAGTQITEILTGSVTFSASTTAAVSFGQTLSASTYKVFLTARADPVGRLYAASPTTTGFTLTNTSSSSITVDWMIVL